MQIDYRNYPHPVLSHFSDDFVKCLYQTVVLNTVSSNTYKFTVTSKTSSKGLLDLVASGDAVHAIHIECSATRYRRVVKSSQENFSFDVPADQLDGRVQLCCFIVAARDIANYAIAEFHPDFGGRSFKVRKGDMLAVDRDRSFIAEKEHDPLRKLPSIFTISKNGADDAPSIDIDIATGSKIVIRLSDELHNAYKQIAADPAMQPVLSSLIIIPALVSVLEIINTAIVNQEIDEFDEKRWFRVLAEKLKNCGYPLNKMDAGFNDSTLVIAQKLIGEPLLSGFRALVKIEETESE